MHPAPVALQQDVQHLVARRGESVAHRLAAGQRHVVLGRPAAGQHRDPQRKIPSRVVVVAVAVGPAVPVALALILRRGGAAVGRRLRLGVALAAVRARLDAAHREADARATLDLGAGRRVLVDDGAVLRRVGHGLVAWRTRVRPSAAQRARSRPPATSRRPTGRSRAAGRRRRRSSPWSPADASVAAAGPGRAPCPGRCSRRRAPRRRPRSRASSSVEVASRRLWPTTDGTVDDAAARWR